MPQPESCQVRRRSRQVQTGYKPHHPTLPNVDQPHPPFPQATGPPDHQDPGRRPPSRATSASTARSKTNHALAGRASLRDGCGQPPARAGLGRVGTGCGIPPTSPQGYHAVTLGAELPEAAAGSRRGLPPGRRVVGRRQGHRDATPAPAFKIIRGRQAAERHPRLPTRRRTSRHGTALGHHSSVRRDGRPDREAGFGTTSVQAARRGHARVDPQGLPGLFSLSRWFREQWQMGHDDGRQWQNTRSALTRVCAAQGWFLPVNGSAPGRIRTCDTRFRKSCDTGSHACYQRLQFGERCTTAVLRRDFAPVRTTIRTTPAAGQSAVQMVEGQAGEEPATLRVYAAWVAASDCKAAEILGSRMRKRSMCSLD